MSESRARAHTEEVLKQVYAERAVQRGRWTNEADDRHSMSHWGTILGTYFGRVLTTIYWYTQPTPTDEAAMRHVDYDRRQIRESLIKLAATAVAAAEAIDRKGANRAKIQA